MYCVQVTGDEFFDCPLGLFKVITVDYREAVKRSAVSKRDQGFFLNGQKMDFLQRFSRSILHCSSLTGEKEWKLCGISESHL